ncbi:hypothetical protein ILUMI_21588 [Ignelater luminosus]|uniref:Retinol dehydrogenase 13 n=1 Tax=Ignelater luminosus TaxID=2038154 RepID=A0A8K0CBT8_IGNLU|nr:hypothetical protein ILUMI_21588 [Ignelater luminosus]
MVCDAVCTSTARLDGKTAIVTGSNTGIGKITVKDFYKRGGRVFMACRNVEKAEEAAEDIKKECEGLQNLGTIVVIKLDLSSLKSIRECAEHLLETEQHIDILVNNAGVMFCPESRTEDGFEMQIGTNHLGHFLFTLLLLPRIIKSAPARIVNVSSVGHSLLRGPMNLDDLNWEKRSYSATQAYFQSKLANVLFTKELARRLQEANIDGVTIYSLHPGAVDTELQRHADDTFFRGMSCLSNIFLKPFFKTPEQGAQTTIYCAVDENASKETGLYYAECKVKEPSSKAKNVEDARKLWDLSLKMVGLPEDYNHFVSM